MYKPIYLLLPIFLIIFSCQGAIQEDSEITNDQYQTDIYLEVINKVEIPNQVAYTLGGEFGELFYFEDEGEVLISELQSGILARISKRGEVVWRIDVPTSPPLSMSDIGNIDKDVSSDDFYVYDRNKRRMFSINSFGKINSSFLVEPDFIDFGINRDGDFVYYTEGFHNTHVTQNDQSFKFFVYDSDNNFLATHFPRPLPRSNVVFNDFDEFYRVDNTLYFQREFSDSVFVFDEDTLTFAYLAKVKNGRTQQLLDDPELPEPYSTIFQDGLSSVSRAVKTDKFQYVREGTRARPDFVVKTLSGDELFRSQVLRVNDEYIFVPQFYNDGYFFSVMYASQFRALQSDAVDDKSLLVSSLPESDLDGLVIHVLKIK